MSIMCILVPAIASIVTVVNSFEDTKLVVRQAKNGVGPIAYILGQLLVELPMALIGVALPIISAVFGVFGISWHALLLALLPILLCYLVMEGMARIASMERSSVAAVLRHVQFCTANFLFMGYMVSFSDAIWPFRVLFYLHPFFWANKAVSWSFLNWSLAADATTEGCESASVAECLYNVIDGEAILPGWRCFDMQPGTHCWGHNGPQLLESVHLKYEFVSSDPEYGFCIAVMSSMMVVFFTSYIGMMVSRCRTSAALPAEEQDKVSKAPECAAVRPCADTLDISQLQYNPVTKCWEV
jgi:hypothetical protein